MTESLVVGTAHTGARKASDALQASIKPLHTSRFGERCVVPGSIVVAFVK